VNLAEALLAALPEMPTRVVADKKYRLNPDVVVREELNENFEPVVAIYIPEKAWMLKVTAEQFGLLQLFNGERNFAEVAQAYTEETGSALTEEEVKDFALGSVESGLWYQSQQERNITLSQKLSDERRKRIKKKTYDLSHMIFQGFNPDAWLGRLHDRVWWIYTPWFTALTLCLFAYTLAIWVGHWSEIGRDTILYYTFTQKTGWDLLEFWVLFLGIGFFHETAHGLTCKHFGARVPNMGFQLIYLVPAFVTEVTEIWVVGGRRERVLSVLAGIWIESMMCGIATVVWVLTPTGSSGHEWAYKIMLITGLITVLVNMNPLIKLDGYFMLSELVGISELKENATGFVSGWVKKNIFRLPVDVDYVPTRRRFLYVPYALISGVYSYGLLFAVSRLTYNIFSKWFGGWAYLMAGLVAWAIFKSRLKRLVTFMKTVYVDKREKLHRALTPTRTAALAVVLLLVVLLPIFPRTTSALFVLEPVNKAVVRAKVGGFVAKILVDENAQVAAGEPVAVLRDLDLESQSARAGADLSIAQANKVKAQVKYASLGPAESELLRATRDLQTANEQLKELRPTSPLGGIVVTPRVRDLEGTYVPPGALLMEIDGVDSLRARLYLPEFEVRDVRVGESVTLRLKSQWRSARGVVQSVAAAPSELTPGLVEENKYKGLMPPSFYIAEVILPNAGELRPGMSGEAKILVSRESIGRKAWRGLRDVIGRVVW